MLRRVRRLVGNERPTGRSGDPAGPTLSADPTLDLDYLFIVTYGRSGSTLLMSMLDSMPGFCIRGENAGVLYDLFTFHSKITAARDRWTGRQTLRPQHPWYGIDGYPDEIALRRMRQLIVDTLLRPEPGTRVAGFKEIRWWMPKPVEYLDFLEAVFPGARFLLNTRNLEDVANSKWWRKKPNAAQSLAKVEERLKDTVGRRGDRGYHVHFDDYVKDPSVLRGLHEWLGVPYDPERVRKLLTTRHSF